MRTCHISLNIHEIIRISFDFPEEQQDQSALKTTTKKETLSSSSIDGELISYPERPAALSRYKPIAKLSPSADPTGFHDDGFIL